MRHITIVFAAAFGLLTAPALAAPQIAVGARIPARLAVTDSSGRARTYASIVGRKGAVLVLFRSAKWCPYCQAQLKDLQAQQLQAKLAQRGYTLNALSYDPPAILADFAKRQAITYTLLSDPKSATIDALGLRDPAYAEGSFAYGVPRATILVIDAKGVVRSKTVAADYKFRPDPAAILKTIDSIR